MPKRLSAAPMLNVLPSTNDSIVCLSLVASDFICKVAERAYSPSIRVFFSQFQVWVMVGVA